jgi:hypothetical protein
MLLVSLKPYLSVAKWVNGWGALGDAVGTAVPSSAAEAKFASLCA